MELTTFISQSIKDIFDGVIEAQKYASKVGGQVNVYQDDCMRRLDYDMAITTLTTKAGGGKVKGKILVVEADLSGEVKKEASTLSRLKFTILVEMPNKVWIQKGKRPGSEESGVV